MSEGNKWLINLHNHSTRAESTGFLKCTYQFLPLHKGAVITRKEWGSATPLPTDSRGWQYIWLRVRTKQEDPTELLFILLWPSLFFSLNRVLRWEMYLQKRRKSKIYHQGKSSFLSEANDLSVAEFGSKKEANQYEFSDYLANYYNSNTQASNSISLEEL